MSISKVNFGQMTVSPGANARAGTFPFAASEPLAKGINDVRQFASLARPVPPAGVGRNFDLNA